MHLSKSFSTWYSQGSLTFGIWRAPRTIESSSTTYPAHVAWLSVGHKGVRSGRDGERAVSVCGTICCTASIFTGCSVLKPCSISDLWRWIMLQMRLHGVESSLFWRGRRVQRRLISVRWESRHSSAAEQSRQSRGFWSCVVACRD